ncbi:type II toxin-antitoxin system RelB/DinJ family antitoxin [Serratia sp. OS31]|uniref:type II toxin-antitoxin system RelB/DinJ family antitoxin n=1 Tax=Serratia sp. OS31 TaxID=2760844 RepID=UPI001602A179|nr:type II toxin-antitoxin system RelB/DinJ family antitoxin [Serratia sp. OS31]MBB1582486.1 type II toxin-antitoxin system RelB/DinJ family antitoxin [Serratia sp. OS31]
MTRDSIVQARIDTNLKQRAEAVFKEMGMTVSEGIRMFLGRIVKEGTMPEELLNGSSANREQPCYQAYNDILSQLEYPETQRNYSQYKSEKLGNMLNTDNRS